MKTPLCILILSLGITTSILSQEQLGILPRLSVSKKINNRVKVQSVIENRLGFIDKKIKHELTDFMVSIADRNSNGVSFISAYTFRLRENRPLHRLSQYVSFVDDNGNHRIANRLGIDQSFISASSNIFRMRYRFNWEKSLNGGAINAREFYLKMGTEVLYSIIRQIENPFELRIVPHIGYEITPRSKIEFSLDHRITSLLQSLSDSRTWSKISWYISL